MNTRQNYAGKGSRANPATQTANSAAQHLITARYRQYLIDLEVAESELHRAYVFTVPDQTMSPQIREGSKVLAIRIISVYFPTASGVVAFATTMNPNSYRIGRVLHTANEVMHLEQDNGSPFAVNLREVDTLLELRKIIGQIIL